MARAPTPGRGVTSLLGRRSDLPYLRDYAVMAIPLCLLVDPRQQTVVLFSEPDQDRYHTRTDRKFGDGIRIPAPFGFELDTAGLIPYRD